MRPAIAVTIIAVLFNPIIVLAQEVIASPSLGLYFGVENRQAESIGYVGWENATCWMEVRRTRDFDEADFAFSLFSTGSELPAFDEPLRIGFGFRIPQSEYQVWDARGELKRDRSEPYLLLWQKENIGRIKWSLRGYYPLSNSIDGRELYWRFELDRLSYNLVEKGNFQFQILGKACYWQDQKSRYSIGLECKYEELSVYYLSGSENCFGLRWSSGPISTLPQKKDEKENQEPIASKPAEMSSAEIFDTKAEMSSQNLVTDTLSSKTSKPESGLEALKLNSTKNNPTSL